MFWTEVTSPLSRQTNWTKSKMKLKLRTRPPKNCWTNIRTLSPSLWPRRQRMTRKLTLCLPNCKRKPVLDSRLKTTIYSMSSRHLMKFVRTWTSNAFNSKWTTRCSICQLKSRFLKDAWNCFLKRNHSSRESCNKLAPSKTRRSKEWILSWRKSRCSWSRPELTSKRDRHCYRSWASKMMNRKLSDGNPKLRTLKLVFARLSANAPKLSLTWSHSTQPFS